MTSNFLKLVTVGFLAMAVTLGCQKADEGKTTQKPAPAEKGKTAAAKAEAGHDAHHGGCLNAIELCAVGHAEVKVEGGTLRCWLVGGENETGKSVRVPDAEIRLAVKFESGEEKPLVLAAKPIAVADETVGDCSYFEGAADWLKGTAKFQATGTVHFKGQVRKVQIRYPEGFDPDDDAPAGSTPAGK
jgi:hypothetical protein